MQLATTVASRYAHAAADRPPPSQVVKSYLQGLWLTATTMFAVLYGDYVPTSHIARFICYALGLIGLLISASITAMFARAMQPSDFEAFAMQVPL